MLNTHTFQTFRADADAIYLSLVIVHYVAHTVRYLHVFSTNHKQNV